jgi:hypothetical protein
MTIRTVCTVIFTSILASGVAQNNLAVLESSTTKSGSPIRQHSPVIAPVSTTSESVVFMPVASPAQGELNFSWVQLQASESTSLSIADIQEKMTLTMFVDQPQAGLNQKSISLSAFDNGIYNISLVVDGKRFEQQILIVK